MPVTLTGSVIKITGGSSTNPITINDVVASIPAANIQNVGNYYNFIGITQILIGDQGTTPTYFAIENIILDSQNQLEIRVDGKRAFPGDTTFRIGILDPATGKGTNGCILSKNIKITGIAGEIHIYGSEIEQYTGGFYFAILYATDNMFNRCGDRIGRCGLFRRNTIKSSDRNGTLTLVPGFSFMLDPNPTGNTRIISSNDDILIVNTVKAEGETIRIEPNVTFKWAYLNAKIINYGKIQNAQQLTSYNDSIFENIMEPKINLVDENGNPVSIQSIELHDSKGNIYTPNQNSNLQSGYVEFSGVVIQKWIDRPGGTQTTNYTDYSPFTLHIVDNQNNQHNITIDLSKRLQEGETYRMIVPTIKLAPRIARIDLAETIMVATEAHDVIYIDVTGLSPTIELIHHPSANSPVVIHSGTMIEISQGVYHYTLDLPNLNLPTIPDYYAIKVSVAGKFDLKTIEIINGNETLTPQTIANTVWNHPTRTITNAELSNLDAPVSSRLAAADYTPPDNAIILDTNTRIKNIEPNIDAPISSRLAAADYTPPDNTIPQNILSLVQDIHIANFGSWKIILPHLIFYDTNGNEIARFLLTDEQGNPVNDATKAVNRIRV